MYEVVLAHRAKKALLKHARSGDSFSKEKFQKLVTLLILGQPLPTPYRDHQLKGSLALFRECHLAFDLLIRYKRNEKLRVITIEEIGTHDEIFGN